MNNLILFLIELAQAANSAADTVLSPYTYDGISFEVVTDGGIGNDILIVYIRTGQAHIMCFPQDGNRDAFCYLVGLDPEVAS